MTFDSAIHTGGVVPSNRLLPMLTATLDGAETTPDPSPECRESSEEAKSFEKRPVTRVTVPECRGLSDKTKTFDNARTHPDDTPSNRDSTETDVLSYSKDTENRRAPVETTPREARPTCNLQRATCNHPLCRDVGMWRPRNIDPVDLDTTHGPSL